MKTSINLIYLGGPTIILEIDGFRIMTDPTLDPKGTAFKISETVTETKLAGPAVSDIGKIDLVLLSHDQHWDNFDHRGRELIASGVPTLTTAAGAERLGGQVHGLRPWARTSVPGNDGTQILITATPARHGPAGTEKITGDVIGFLIEVKNAPDISVYITGDTVFYEGVAEVSRRYKPNYVFFFAGAARPRGPFNVTMSSNDALDTASAFPDAKFVPLHFEGWSHYTEDGQVLKGAFEAVGIGDRLLFPRPGEKIPLA